MEEEGEGEGRGCMLLVENQDKWRARDSQRRIALSLKLLLPPRQAKCSGDSCHFVPIYIYTQEKGNNGIVGEKWKGEGGRMDEKEKKTNEKKRKGFNKGIPLLAFVVSRISLCSDALANCHSVQRLTICIRSNADCWGGVKEEGW